MGKFTYNSSSTYPSPRSSNLNQPNIFPSFPMNFSGLHPESQSLKQPSSTPRPSKTGLPLSSAGPRSPTFLSPISRSPRHPNYSSPPPEPHLFLDAKNKDLPYKGSFPVNQTSLFDAPLGLEREGDLLMAVLTGVQGSSCEKPARNVDMLLLDADKSTFEMEEDISRSEPQAAPGRFRSRDSVQWNHKSNMDKTRDTKTSSSVSNPSFKASPSSATAEVVDIGVDTMDLQVTNLNIWDEDNEDVHWLFDSAKEEALYKLSRELEEHDGKKPMQLVDYLTMVKRSMGRIGLRAEMLQELSLGEDIGMGIPISEMPIAPALEKTGTEIKIGETVKDLATKVVPTYKGAMRATSLVLKKLRRLAGLLHTEQQSIDLKDIYDWLRHLGALASDFNKVKEIASELNPQYEVGSPQSGTESAIVGKDGTQKVDWRLPSSPQQALLMAQADLRQRLAYLYDEQSHIKKRKEQLEAAKRLVGKKLSIKEVKKISGYLHGLQTLEVEYEGLGGRIAKNVDDMRSLETQFKHIINKEKVESIEKDAKVKPRKKNKRGGPKPQSTLEYESDGDESDDENDSGPSAKGHENETNEAEHLLKRKNRKINSHPLIMSDALKTDVQMPTKDTARPSIGSKDHSTSNKLDLRTGDSKTDVISSIQSESLKKDKRDMKVEGWLSTFNKNTADLEARVQSLTNSSSKQMSPHLTDRKDANAHSGPNWVNSYSVNVHEENIGGLVTPYMEKPKTKEAHHKDSAKDSLLSAEKRPDRQTVSEPVVLKTNKAVQTTNSELLSLMDGMLDALNKELPSGGDFEEPAAKLKRILKENKRMKVQLRFWRSRNWYENSVKNVSSFEASAGGPGSRFTLETLLSRRGSRTGLAGSPSGPMSQTEFPAPPPLIMESSSEDEIAHYFKSIQSSGDLGEQDGGALDEDKSRLQGNINARGHVSPRISPRGPVSASVHAGISEPPLNAKLNETKSKFGNDIKQQHPRVVLLNSLRAMHPYPTVSAPNNAVLSPRNDFGGEVSPNNVTERLNTRLYSKSPTRDVQLRRDDQIKRQSPRSLEPLHNVRSMNSPSLRSPTQLPSSEPSTARLSLDSLSANPRISAQTDPLSIKPKDSEAVHHLSSPRLSEEIASGSMSSRKSPSTLSKRPPPLEPLKVPSLQRSVIGLTRAMHPLKSTPRSSETTHSTSSQLLQSNSTKKAVSNTPRSTRTAQLADAEAGHHSGLKIVSRQRSPQSTNAQSSRSDHTDSLGAVPMSSRFTRPEPTPSWASHITAVDNDHDFQESKPRSPGLLMVGRSSTG